MYFDHLWRPFYHHCFKLCITEIGFSYETSSDAREVFEQKPMNLNSHIAERTIILLCIGTIFCRNPPTAWFCTLIETCYGDFPNFKGFNNYKRVARCSQTHWPRSSNWQKLIYAKFEIQVLKCAPKCYEWTVWITQIFCRSYISWPFYGNIY